VNDLVEADAGEQVFKRGAIGKVAVHELEGSAERAKVVEVALFEARVVEIVEVIEGPDGMAGMEEALAEMRADEAGATGDQEIHAGTLAEVEQGCRGPPRAAMERVDWRACGPNQRQADTGCQLQYVVEVLGCLPAATWCASCQ